MMTDYLGVHDAIKQNGDRHKVNGDKHYAEGRFEYAIGSYLKALRNWNVYLDFIEFENSVPSFVQPIIDRVAADMANALIYGTSVIQDGEAIMPKDYYKNG